MRIAVTGSAGSGKTSLAKSLSEKLDLKIIPEYYDVFFDEKGRYIKPPKKLVQKIDEVLELKHQHELKAESFIADRCPVDLFNLWMTRSFHANESNTDKFYKKCIKYLKKYDYIILVPWGDIPLKQIEKEEGSNRKRVMKPWVQFQHHSTIIGIAMQWVPLNKIIAVPKGLDDVEQRCKYVVNAISK